MNTETPAGQRFWARTGRTTVQNFPTGPRNTIRLPVGVHHQTFCRHEPGVVAAFTLLGDSSSTVRRAVHRHREAGPSVSFLHGARPCRSSEPAERPTPHRDASSTTKSQPFGCQCGWHWPRRTESGGRFWTRQSAENSRIRGSATFLCSARTGYRLADSVKPGNRVQRQWW